MRSREDREVLSVAFMLALTTGIKGRYRLSDELGLGEGVLRGLYRELRSKGFIEVHRGGARLTQRGFEELSRILRRSGILEAKVLEDVEAWGERFMGVVAALERGVKSVVKARDAVVRAGAAAALIVRRDQRGKLYLPMVEGYDLREEAPQVYDALSSMPEDAAAYVVALSEKLLPCVEGVIALSKLASKGLV